MDNGQYLESDDVGKLFLGAGAGGAGGDSCVAGDWDWVGEVAGEAEGMTWENFKLDILHQMGLHTC